MKTLLKVSGILVPLLSTVLSGAPSVEEALLLTKQWQRNNTAFAVEIQIECNGALQTSRLVKMVKDNQTYFVMEVPLGESNSSKRYWVVQQEDGTASAYFPTSNRRMSLGKNSAGELQKAFGQNDLEQIRTALDVSRCSVSQYEGFFTLSLILSDETMSAMQVALKQDPPKVIEVTMEPNGFINEVRQFFSDKCIKTKYANLNFRSDELAKYQHCLGVPPESYSQARFHQFLKEEADRQ